MKKVILFFGLFFALQISFAQVETKFFKKEIAFDQVKFIKDHPKANKTMKLPSFDTQMLINEDKLIESTDRPPAGARLPTRAPADVFVMPAPCSHPPDSYQDNIEAPAGALVSVRHYSSQT